jgi:cation diffusion facilitator CzcD-associated flavoprotein CzcO
MKGAFVKRSEDGVARSDVLIIGAGPTGLVLALWLTKLGVKSPSGELIRDYRVFGA